MAEKSLFRYALVKSSLPEAKGVLMGRFLHNDPTCGLDEFAGDMAENRPNLDKASCRMMIGVLAACAADRMKANPGRIDLGDFSLEPAIAKSMPALDSPLGDENKIYLAARLSSDMRNCLADVTPTRISTDELDVSVANVVGPDRRTIKGVEPFELQGVGLSVNGPDEEVKVVAADGTAVKAVFDSDDGTGQRIVMHLPVALPPGKATVQVYTRGRGADVETAVFELNPLTVTVLAGETPPEPPVPTGPAVTAINDGTFHAGGGNVVTGANMRFADAFPGNHLVIRDSEGTDMEAMISTDASTPVTETSFSLNIDEGTPLTDGEEYIFEFEMLDADGELVTVTQTARWVAG